MSRRRLLRVLPVLMLAVGLVVTLSASAGAQVLPKGYHFDRLAQFASGRTANAEAWVDFDNVAGTVRANSDYWAIGLSGTAVPIRVTITNFKLIGYRCAGNQCNPAVTYTKCQTGCTFTSTSSNPVVPLSGVWHNAYRDNQGNIHGWRTRAEDVDLVILNTANDSTSNKCVSSYLWRFDTSSNLAPSC